MESWHLRPRRPPPPSGRRHGHRRERRRRSGHVNDPLRQGGEALLVATRLVPWSAPLWLTALPRRRRRVASVVLVSDGTVVAVAFAVLLDHQGRQAPLPAGRRPGLGLLAGAAHRRHWIHGHLPRGETLPPSLRTVPNRGGGAWPCRPMRLWRSRASSQTRMWGPGRLCPLVWVASGEVIRARREKGGKRPVRPPAVALGGQQAPVRQRPRLQDRTQRQGLGWASKQAPPALPTGCQHWRLVRQRPPRSGLATM